MSKELYEDVLKEEPNINLNKKKYQDWEKNHNLQL